MNIFLNIVFLPLLVFGHDKVNVVGDTMYLNDTVFLEYGAGSPENILSPMYDGFRDDMFEYLEERNYNSIYVVGYSEDDPRVTPYLPNTYIVDTDKMLKWREIFKLANRYGLMVNLLLAEEETMNYPYENWYQSAVQYFGDLNITYIISEEYDQPPHKLSPEEVISRCKLLRGMDSITPIGVHQIGVSVYGFIPFLTNNCLDFFSIQWYRTSNPLDAVNWLQERTNKRLVVHEPSTITHYTEAEWCQIVQNLHRLNTGVGFYWGSKDQNYFWHIDGVPECY